MSEPNDPGATLATRRIGDALNAVLTAHEQLAHGGDACRLERINLVAYLAHRLGFRPADFPALVACLEDYEHEHERRSGGDA